MFSCIVQIYLGEVLWAVLWSYVLDSIVGLYLGAAVLGCNTRLYCRPVLWGFILIKYHGLYCGLYCRALIGLHYGVVIWSIILGQNCVLYMGAV